MMIKVSSLRNTSETAPHFRAGTAQTPPAVAMTGATGWARRSMQPKSKR